MDRLQHAALVSSKHEPRPISQIDSEESLKRPEARGQLGRGWGNLGGHGSGNSAESSDHPLSCLRDFVSECLEKASTSVFKAAHCLIFVEEHPNLTSLYLLCLDDCLELCLR